jgi:PmbA protein
MQKTLNQSELEKAYFDLSLYLNKTIKLPWELSIDSDLFSSCSVREGELEGFDSGSEHSVCIKIFDGNKKALATCNGLDICDLKQTADNAKGLLRYSQKDEFTYPIEQELLANTKDFINLQCSFANNLKFDEMVKIAQETEERAYSYSKYIVNSEGVSVHLSNANDLYANSNGFFAQQKSSNCSISSSVIAKKKDEMQNGYDWNRVRNTANIKDLHKGVGEKSAKEAVDSLNSSPIKSGKYNIIFTPNVANSFLRIFISATYGSRLYKKTTFLENSLHKSIFPSWFSLVEVPHITGGWGSSNFDNDGVATKEKIIVEQGILQTHLFGCYSARKTGNKTTGNSGGITNIEVTSNTTGGIEDLIKTMHNGLIITDTIGDGVDFITADYSKGAKGFLVENGVIKHPVDNITISGNLLDMFMNIEHIAEDCEDRSSLKTGSLLLKNIVVGSNG